MHSHEWFDFDKEAHLSLERLRPRIEALLKDEPDAGIFLERLEKHFPRAFRLLHQLYSDHYDFFYHLEQILRTCAEMFRQRSAELRELDKRRASDRRWFQSEKQMGGVLYVDLFAGNLARLRDKIPYFKELGITYLHLMPLFQSPEKNSDGGYAVSDYRTANPTLGTMDELVELATLLRNNGISLVLDFVFNHTSDEHTWAKRALAGDETYQKYYYMFDDRTMPDRYEMTLREIFPEQSPGSFVYRPEIKKWIWSTFYYFQWDLNYSNPAVFNAMLAEMLFLANQGVEVLRLDAVAFIWKRLGTSCENLPEAHMIVQAYNALVQVTAPAMLFKSEAIVHPDAVASYISVDEAQLSYNPTLMALLWESLATKKVELLQRSMSRLFTLPEGCAWVNYIRVHDDIGWTFADEDASELGINGYDHRQFLNQFYSGMFPGSFACGVPFGYNPINKDMRIAGTAASLAGLEQAVQTGDERLIDLALRRLLLIYSVIISAGGIPLLYFGDEIAALNDYSYRDDPVKREDTRWVHRPHFDWERAKQRHNADTVPGRMFQGLTRLIRIRQANPVFATNNTTFFDTQNVHVLGYMHNRRLLVLANFSETKQSADLDIIGAYAPLHKVARDLLQETDVRLQADIVLEPYEFKWLLYD